MKKRLNLKVFNHTSRASENIKGYFNNWREKGSEFWRERLIYATIFLLPAYLIRVDVLGLPTNALEILIAICFGWTLLFNKKPLNFLKPNFKKIISLILISLIFSAIWNKNYAISLGIIKGWFVAPLLLAIAAKNVISKEKKQNIYNALYWSAVFVATISLGYYFFGKVTFDGRLQGIFNSPNYLAMYLAPAILIGLISHKKNFISGTSIVLLLSAFWLTYSYAAWIAIAVSWLVVMAVENKKKINFWKISVVLIISALIILSQWNNQKFVDLRSLTERSSISSRTMIWSATKKILQENWLTGIGPGNFQQKYLEYQTYFPPYLEWAVPHPHNMFLSFWLSAGLAGLCGFIRLIGAWFKSFWKKEKTTLWLISFGIMIYFLLHGLVDTTYFKNDLAVIFWLNFFILL